MTRRAPLWRGLIVDHRDLAAERERRGQLDAVAAPEAPGVVPARRAAVGEQAHGLVGGRDELGAVDRLQRRRLAAVAAGEPAAREPRHGRERVAVVARDRLHEPVLVMALDRALQLARPGALVVALVPGRDGVAQHVQLDAALALAGPDV